MLVELSKVKEFLRNRLAADSARTRQCNSRLTLVHVPQVLDLRLSYLELIIQKLNAIVHLNFIGSNHTDEATVLTIENYCRALFLMSKYLLIGKNFLASFVVVDAFELEL